MNLRRQLFLKHVGQTSTEPRIIEVSHAEGVFVYDVDGRRYFDLASGIGPSILGHGNEAVMDAIQDQSRRHLHTMVYGEHVQASQVDLAQLLVDNLPSKLNSVYFLSSGSEAVEGAVKLAKLETGRHKVLSAADAYHGSTMGAESLRSDIDFLQHMAPLIPGVDHIRFNNLGDLDLINKDIACVIMETIQAEAGVITPSKDYMAALRRKCDENGTLLILDEIQMGLGRTGKLWAFEHFEIVPDILVLGKALGGGLPLSAFISDKAIMSNISTNPVLAHLTTFGGNPLCCAAGKAIVSQIINDKWFDTAEEKGRFFKDLLNHESIVSKRQIGLMIAMDFKDSETSFKVAYAWNDAGIMSDLLLFSHNTIRIAPPLTISEDEMREAAQIMLRVLDTI